MSKSKGEFLTLSLLEEKGYAPMVYRFFCMQSHYRRSLVFSYEGLDNAKAAYEKLLARVAALDENDGEIDTAAYERLRTAFVEAMDNDLNTSLGVTALYDVLKENVNGKTKLALIADFDRVLSLNLIEGAKALKNEVKEDAPAEDDEFVTEIKKLIAERAEAKKAKNFALADEIRQKLSDMGVTIKDTRQGTEFTINK
jgi:cysteinyl-tRNA synthetase